uniref:(California timema) hypothetical protein n=1 Tax=Timema californicum TaxID=61474 RepID=A0A7R9PET9_TIMCA|nr:unnamed protein product [Timema californicum]
MLQQTLQGMQQLANAFVVLSSTAEDGEIEQLMESKRRQAEDELKVRELQARLQHHKGDKDEVPGEEGAEPQEEQKVDTTESPVFSTSMLTDREARLIGTTSPVIP